MSAQNSTQIVIVGGGISGLSLLHYLHERYARRNDIKILLLEKAEKSGGKVMTRQEKGMLFESGPNGFLDTKGDVLALCEALGLKGELVHAQPTAKRRYFLHQNRLHAFPGSLKDFVLSPELSWGDKLKVFAEILTPGAPDSHETVYEFGCRHFGQRVTELFLDPFINGIYGGDIKNLNLALAFPQFFELEQNYGSFLRGMLAKRNGITKRNKPKPLLTSLRQGLGQLIHALEEKYKNIILCQREVLSIDLSNSGGYWVKTKQETLPADQLFLCLPAPGAARLLRSLCPSLSERLGKIAYAPIAVVGFLYRKEALASWPDGFGYLVPSQEKNMILGVLFESNIFPGRCAPDHFLLRVFLGGMLHPEIVSKEPNELIGFAQKEVEARLHTSQDPTQSLCVLWPQAIPQYDQQYAQFRSEILPDMMRLKNLQVVANYWNGISLTDCMRNAKKAADSCAIAEG